MMRHAWLIFAAFAMTALVAVADDEPAADPLHVHMISGSKAYQSEPSLKAFAAYLEKELGATCTFSLGSDRGKDLPNLDALGSADVLVVFCRRQKVPEDQLKKIKDWCAAGKPVVGIRTASHAFQDWLAMDKEIFGGSYKGHGKGEPVQVKVHEANQDHPILEGVEPWTRDGALYRNPDNAGDAILLLTGTGANSGDTQPVAWARVYDKKKDARAFMTSMGYPHDFKNENFRRLLVGAIRWTAKRNK